MATADISQWTAAKMTEAFTAINAKIGADPADYESVLINEYMVRVEAINPHQRENVDQYTYEVGTVEVKPVDVSTHGPGATEMAAFKGDTVKPEMLAQTMSSAPTDSGVVESPKIEWVMVKKNMIPSTVAPQLADNNGAQISIEVKGPRADKIVYYDLTGHVQKVTQG